MPFDEELIPLKWRWTGEKGTIGAGGRIFPPRERKKSGLTLEGRRSKSGQGEPMDQTVVSLAVGWDGNGQNFSEC